ncbi:hypothetical protein Tco_1370160 [Tanacetum coccineum]
MILVLQPWKAAKTLSRLLSQKLLVHSKGEQRSSSKGLMIMVYWFRFLQFAGKREDLNLTKFEVNNEVNPGRAELILIRQEEAGLAEAMRLQALQDEDDARQVHLDALLAKRIQEEQELSEQQQKRKAEVQEAAQFYTEED